MRRRAAIISLCMAMTLLTSCVSSSRSAGESAEDIRTHLISSDIKMTTSVIADYGNRVYDFTLTYDTAACLIEVKEPELLTGLTVTVSETDGSTVLSYDGAELNTGTFNEEGLSPISVLPALVKQWREGYILECHFETVDDVETVAIKTDISDEVVSTSWFDRTTGAPLKAEIAIDNQVVIQCAFSEVSFNSQ